MVAGLSVFTRALRGEAAVRFAVRLAGVDLGLRGLADVAALRSAACGELAETGAGVALVRLLAVAAF